MRELISKGVIVVSTVFFCLLSLQNTAASDLQSGAGDDIRKRIVTLHEGALERATLFATKALTLFYERRGYKPAWSDEKGPLPQASELVDAVLEADKEGLRPEDYHLARIRALFEEIGRDLALQRLPDPGKLADLDILLTDAFLIYGSHLVAGRVDPETKDVKRQAERRKADLAVILERAIFSGKVKGALKELPPAGAAYEGLRQALVFYKGIAARGGWPKLDIKGNIREGASGEQVALLRRRLTSSGDLKEKPVAEEGFFDDKLKAAVRSFQRRHGLSDDGIAGPRTTAALNVPVAERISRIEVNMERWRWLPREPGDRYIIVNIANFELEVVENGRNVLPMRAIVGRPYRETPVFASDMTYIVLNPYWHIPRSIAVKDILPKVKEDVHYLDSEGVRVFQGLGREMKEVASGTIDWSSVDADNFNYRFRQYPGPKNALGRVKFMFPNKYDVYLHDTPATELFAREVRTFSSGCIRIEKPLELAEYLLRDNGEWSMKGLVQAIKEGKERVITLKRPIRVYLQYWTAWANEDGSISFRNDIYGRDRLLRRALHEKPPGQ